MTEARNIAGERAVCVKPSELRTMLAFVGLRDYRADSAVRLLAHVGTLNRSPPTGIRKPADTESDNG